MKNILFLLTFLCSVAVFAQQQGSIKGTITDLGMNDEPLLFAHVQLKGATKTTETNFHGNFEIDELAPGAYTLVVSYLGYETIEIPAVVSENKITKVKGGLAALSFSMDDLEITEDLTEKVATREQPKK